MRFYVVVCTLVLILQVGLFYTVMAQTDEMLEEKIQNLENILGTVARQMMLQQLYAEEQARSDSNSGLVRIRNNKQGTRSYYSASHTNEAFMSVHNHPSSKDTMGLAEIVASLDGVEFRTRHNDYLLKMKSTSSNAWGTTEDIPFPDVPPEVTQNVEVDDQVTEMREWFQAWVEQNYTIRDYRPYFKPVLCYLEGGWTNSRQDTIDQYFESDHHFLDASDWEDLHEKVRFTSFAGSKHPKEDFAYLPTTVVSFINDTIPVLAQWNFRILCHPLTNDLPLNRLDPVDDIKARMDLALSFEEYVWSRAGRYQLVLQDSDDSSDEKTEYTLLDKLMSEIPGLDSYDGSITDDIFWQTAYEYGSNMDTPLNMAFYHRTTEVLESDPNGSNVQRRGFTDENLFVALNTRPESVGLSVEACNPETGLCKSWVQQVSYALPLEIIYLTPLSKWNPFDITDKGRFDSELGQTVTEGGRDGSQSLATCYDGVNSDKYFLTPTNFFEGQEVTYGPYDGKQTEACVLDSAENMHTLKGSGLRVHFPNITGIGRVRQRYPIMPIAGEGSGVWKEIDALTDLVLNPNKFKFMYSGLDYAMQVLDLHFVTRAAGGQFGSHVHHIDLIGEEANSYLNGEKIDVVTDVAFNHYHVMKINRLEVNGVAEHHVEACDGSSTCWDLHPNLLDETID